MRTEPLRIYVAGPYTAKTPADIVSNVERAIDVGIALFKKGHIPFIPHLTHFVDLRAKEKGIPVGWEEYIRWDLGWLSLCDALIYLGSSPGADLELASAQRLGKRVFHSLDDVPTVRAARDGRGGAKSWRRGQRSLRPRRSDPATARPQPAAPAG